MLKVYSVPIALFLVLYYFIEHSDAAFGITPQEFNLWQCDSICNNVSNVKSYCAKIASRFLNNPHAKSVIKQRSGCQSVYINFASTVMATSLEGVAQQMDAEPKYIGVCELDNNTFKCISKGEGSNDLLVYDYSGGACTPDQNLENFMTGGNGGDGCVGCAIA